MRRNYILLASMLLCCRYCIDWEAAAISSPLMSPSPSPSAAPSPHSYSGNGHFPKVHEPNSSTIPTGTLDPSQAQALAALGIFTPGTEDPCKTQRAILQCDEGAALRRIVSLKLEYCTEGAIFPYSAWANISRSLRSLTFNECPAHPFKVPPLLSHTLTSLSCTASLGTSVSDALAPPLPAGWLAAFTNLAELSVSDVIVDSPSLASIISFMSNLQQITFSNTNLSGFLPVHFPPSTVSIRLPGNELRGPIPTSIAALSQLQILDLSSNSLKGILPSSLSSLNNLQFLNLAGNHLTGPALPDYLSNLSALVYIDLSGNELNGSIPPYLMSMRSLRYVDLRDNNLQGEIPLSEGYLSTLNTFKVGGNFDLCYNKSMIKARYAGGAFPCEDGDAQSPRGSDDMSPAPAPQLDPFKRFSPQRGPNIVVVVIALALICTVGAILFAIVIAKKCAASSKA